MKVLFIYPDVSARGGRFHYGISQISAVLKIGGHQTSLLQVTRQMSKKKLISEVKCRKPDLVAFSSTTNQFPQVQSYASWIRQTINLPTICGGIHATLCPNEVISCSGIDVVCIGEGEYPALEFVNALERGEDFEHINNLWVKRDGVVTKNPLRPLIAELDGLPFVDREIFQYERVLRRRGGTADFMAGRGCPYSCTYCCNHAIRKVFQGKGSYCRIRSVRNVLDEIKCVTDEYSFVKALDFDDDTFTLFRKWVREFCKEYKKEFDYPFWCNVRSETLDREILGWLKEAGCDTIKIGVESGNEWLRRTVLKRPMTNEQIVRSCKTAHELGLKVYTFNMVGLPFETPSMARETLELNREIAPNFGQTSIFYPYPNTELYELCEQNHFLTDRTKASYIDEDSTLNLPTLTQEQISYHYMKLRDLHEEAYMATYHPELRAFYRMMRSILGLRTTHMLYVSWGILNRISWGFDKIMRNLDRPRAESCS